MVKKRKTRKSKKRRERFGNGRWMSNKDIKAKNAINAVEPAHFLKVLYPDYLKAPRQKDTPLYLFCTGLSNETGTSVEKWLEYARLLHFGLLDMDFNWTSKAHSIPVDESEEPVDGFPVPGPDPTSQSQSQLDR